MRSEIAGAVSVDGSLKTLRGGSGGTAWVRESVCICVCTWAFVCLCVCVSMSDSVFVTGRCTRATETGGHLGTSWVGDRTDWPTLTHASSQFLP